MTEEQIEQNAEEYARKSLSKDCCDLKLEVYKKTIQAYIAGATENGTQWHDLRKDPNDLPKGRSVVLNQVGARTNYDPNRGFLGFEGVGIKAWCEIPLFEEG